MSVQDWATMCVAAGIDIRRLKPDDLYDISGRIIRDEWLRKRALAEGANNTDVLKRIDRVSTMKAMTENERVALRERIMGVIQIPVKR